MKKFYVFEIQFPNGKSHFAYSSIAKSAEAYKKQQLLEARYTLTGKRKPTKFHQEILDLDIAEKEIQCVMHGVFDDASEASSLKSELIANHRDHLNQKTGVRRAKQEIAKEKMDNEKKEYTVSSNIFSNFVSASVIFLKNIF